ncbi:hypothetical protein DTO166G4_3635 [Paecilomyces variotii]|nr:hypothetical protein DTO166G4_3635 [Paecilomyces variotii]KAJ9237471.1 hypothetical protein DTO166G5_3561 [Paecilomyces variotii]KAJ9263773.1 hypothetical protein DTO195F2_2690 [Paecilomyces variotii]KAJ9307225.1 hypothetical protein DTO217A2_3284 [Paecilomyces variotii]KAJ9370295.1 hypothetical protein DTO282E5_5004 [Paecilomyces variotii]
MHCQLLCLAPFILPMIACTTWANPISVHQKVLKDPTGNKTVSKCPHHIEVKLPPGQHLSLPWPLGNGNKALTVQKRQMIPVLAQPHDEVWHGGSGGVQLTSDTSGTRLEKFPKVE